MMVKEMGDHREIEATLGLYHSVLRGHEAQRQQVMDGRDDCHAWLIGGMRGIGKGTFALHAARALLKGDGWTDIDDNDPYWRRMVLGGHLDFFLLRPSSQAKTKTRRITIEQLRERLQHLSLSHHESGKKVLVIDALEDMTFAAQQTLLKTLEEPPPHCVILIVSHAPARVLATIRSRCRLLMLRPLDEVNFEAVVRREHPHLTADIKTLYQWSGGAAGVACQMIAMKHEELMQQTWQWLHEADASQGEARRISEQWTKEPQAWHILMRMVDGFFYHHTHTNHAHKGALFDLWDSYQKMTRRAGSLHLPKAHIVFLLLQRMNRWQGMTHG